MGTFLFLLLLDGKYGEFVDSVAVVEEAPIMALAATKDWRDLMVASLLKAITPAELSCLLNDANLMAIKCYRRRTYLGLRESKDIIWIARAIVRGSGLLNITKPSWRY